MPCWIYAGSAVSGVAMGLALSVLLLDHSSLEDAAYVQRAPLPDHSGLTLQLQSLGHHAGDEMAGLESTATAEPEDLSEAAVSATQASQNDGPEFVLVHGQRVLGIDFDLGETDNRSNDLQITKSIHLNGQSVGVANLAIDQQSRLRVSSEDLSNLLPEELFARIDNGSNYIGFDDLRARGLDISYDPLADVIEIVI